MSQKGMLMVVSGPSGVGKDAVRIRLLERCPTLKSSVSATTRAIRPGELDGVDYHFLAPGQFEEMIARGEFLEHTLYNGNHYGTPRRFVFEQLAAGQDVLLKIEVQGALKVREFFPEAVLIFMVPPTMQELWRRIEGRNSGTYPDRVNRFHRAYEELMYAPQYDYIVVNDNLDPCVEDIRTIYMAEGLKKARNGNLWENLAKEVVDT